MNEVSEVSERNRLNRNARCPRWMMMLDRTERGEKMKSCSIGKLRLLLGSSAQEEVGVIHSVYLSVCLNRWILRIHKMRCLDYKRSRPACIQLRSHWKNLGYDRLLATHVFS